MKIAPKLRRKFIVAGVLFACAATPSFAIFGLGDIVFDPTNYAELITQATTAYSHYTAFVHNVEHFSWKQSWQTEKNALEHVPFRNVFGETDGMDAALTTNNSAAAQAAWQNSTVQVNSGATVYLATQNSGSASRSQLAMIEASDSTSPACLNAVGAYRAAVASNASAEQNLQSSQLDTGDDTNSEVQQLNLVNAAQAQQLVEMKQQGMLHACLAQQMAVANMQQRNAAANDLNTWGFVHPNAVQWEAVEEIPGQPAITPSELLAAALRHRPDRIIIGEIRNECAYDLLQAMNTGHGGTMSTIHAASAIDALSRLSNLALSARSNLNHSFIRTETAAAIDFVLYCERAASGARRVREMITANVLSTSPLPKAFSLSSRRALHPLWG